MKRIPLTQGYFAIVDDEDYERLNEYKWCYCKGYAFRRAPAVNGKRAGVWMHREVLGLHADNPMRGDHRFGNTLDNRRAKLRPATNAQNTRNTRRSTKNTTGFKGVSFRGDTGRWKATIETNGLTHHLGYHATPEAAHAAYCVAANKLFHEFANSGA